MACPEGANGAAGNPDPGALTQAFCETTGPAVSMPIVELQLTEGLNLLCRGTRGSCCTSTAPTPRRVFNSSPEASSLRLCVRLLPCSAPRHECPSSLPTQPTCPAAHCQICLTLLRSNKWLWWLHVAHARHWTPLLTCQIILGSVHVHKYVCRRTGTDRHPPHIRCVALKDGSNIP